MGESSKYPHCVFLPIYRISSWMFYNYHGNKLHEDIFFAEITRRFLLRNGSNFDEVIA